MKYKGFIVDLDNTLYDYPAAHRFAYEKASDYGATTLHIDRKIFDSTYSTAREIIHQQLRETAASHNRLLYFQKLLELLHINPLLHTTAMYNIYWDNFLNHMEPFHGVDVFFKKHKNNICVLTDLTAHIQHRKMHQLGLDAYCDKIVTSEEVGVEKPHPYMFKWALEKLELHKTDVCVIGDDFKKDILGATQFGLDAIWINHYNTKENDDNADRIRQVNHFNEVISIL